MDKITSVSPFPKPLIEPSSAINGAVNDYKVTIQAASPLLSGDSVSIDFPTEIIMPGGTAGTITCSDPTGVTSVTCSKTAQ